jgi:hypothetical protein
MLISLLIPKILLRKEKFVDNENEIIHTYTSMERVYLYIMGYNPDFYYKWDIVDKIIVAILYLITFFISISAAYLSFKCTWKGAMRNFFYRFIFAVFAFLLGPLYLIWYFFVNYIGNLC